MSVTITTRVETEKTKDLLNANFPMDADGKVYHLAMKKGDIAKNILTVGDPDRAKLIARECLDINNPYIEHCSNRGFTSYTGTKDGVPMTVMAIGMGMPMMDFFVREARKITEGPINIIRLGSCGTPKFEIGTLVVAKVSYQVLTNPDSYINPDHKGSHFIISRPLEPDNRLHELLVKALQNRVPMVQEAADATTDSFYGSQGRLDSEFEDGNENLINEMEERYPETGSIQMETFKLFELAKLNEIAKKHRDIRVAACAIALANRRNDKFLSMAEKHKLEKDSGDACLEALKQMHPMPIQ